MQIMSYFKQAYILSIYYIKMLSSYLFKTQTYTDTFDTVLEWGFVKGTTLNLEMWAEYNQLLQYMGLDLVPSSDYNTNNQEKLNRHQTSHGL